jgi:type IV pilus assembly protein PilA
MVSWCPRRSQSSEGFTLIELLVVLVVIGMLVTVAVPSYRGLRTRSADSSAKAIIRAAMPAATNYGLNNNGSATDSDSKATTTGFQGLTTALLRTIDRKTATTYCLTTTQQGRVWSVLAPGVVSFKNNATCT